MKKGVLWRVRIAEERLFLKEHGNVKEPKYLEGFEVDGSKVVNYYRDLKSKQIKHFFLPALGSKTWAPLYLFIVGGT